VFVFVSYDHVMCQMWTWGEIDIDSKKTSVFFFKYYTVSINLIHYTTLH